VPVWERIEPEAVGRAEKPINTGKRKVGTRRLELLTSIVSI
jgi:hypothetical protein